MEIHVGSALVARWTVKGCYWVYVQGEKYVALSVASCRKHLSGDLRPGSVFLT